VSGVLATASFAAVASAAPAGGGVQSATSRPDVTAAAITDQPVITNAGGTPTAKVCFDAQIASPVAAAFAVSGTDVTGTGNPLVPTGAASIPAELNCANLTFAAGTNLAGFSTLEVAAGAVSPPGGGAGTNPQGAVALTGGNVVPTAGRTAGPNLTATSVASPAGGDEVTFTFDKLIAQAGGTAPVAARFGYYTAAGVRTPASAVVTIGDRSVRVKFAGASVAAGARVFAEYGAVTLAGQPDQGNSATSAAAGGGAPPPTTLPDLTGVTRVPSLQATFDLTYDQNITSTTVIAPNCIADTPAGHFAGTAVAVQNATTVRVTFGGLAASSGADEEIVRITDAGGCAVDTAALTALSSIGTIAVQNKDHTPGFTSGPDLNGCAAPAGGTDVTYSFDEKLTTGAVPAGGFGLLDADGVRTSGSLLQVTDNRATIRYGSAGVLAAAAACTVDRNAISDRQPGAAEPSSLNTVKVNSLGTPENASATPPVSTPPPTTNPGPATKFVPRAARSLGISTRCNRSKGRVKCTTKGTLKLATALSPLGKKNICIGKVRVRFTSGKKSLSSRTVTLRKTCTYTSTVTFRATARQRTTLRVQARYGGSVVSRAKSSKTIKARVRR
jgi:hypothetical protein